MWNHGITRRIKDVNIKDCNYQDIPDKTSKKNVEENIWAVTEIKAVIPQGSVQRPTFYNIWIYYIPKRAAATIELYVNFAAILGSSRRPQFAKTLLQRRLSKLQKAGKKVENPDQYKQEHSGIVYK